MQKTVYNDYQYAMQDTAHIYVGCKYSFAELAEAEEVPFKFRLVMQKYIAPDASPEDTLETYLYYLPADSFSVKLFRQMKARVKVNVLEEKKKLFGGKKKMYVTKTIDVAEMTKWTTQEKQGMGLVIQEIIVSKLALAAL